MKYSSVGDYVASGDLNVFLEITAPRILIQSKIYKSSPPETPGVFLSKVVLKTCSIFTGEHPPYWHYWNHTLTWVFSCKFAAYLQITFSWDHVWRTSSEYFIKTWTKSLKNNREVNYIPIIGASLQHESYFF